MSSGTSVIQGALQKISAHSPLQPAPPEAIETGRLVLNSMLSEWEDDGINLSIAPLETAGSELSEPLGTRNAIMFNLALALAPDFPGAQVSDELRRQAKKSYNKTKRIWKVIEIPKPQVRETLPQGQGNMRNSKWDYTFFPEDSEIG